MKQSRVRKTSNDSIDSESITRYLMLPRNKVSYEFPEELKNLREYITALNIITAKIGTAKNNVNRIIEMLERFRTPEEFVEADAEELSKVSVQ